MSDLVAWARVSRFPSIHNGSSPAAATETDAAAVSARAAPATQTRALAHRLSQLLAAWIGISLVTDLLMQMNWPGLPTLAVYLILGVVIIARYPLWAHRWFTPSTPLSIHLASLGVGTLVTVIGCLAFPGRLLSLLAVLGVEGYFVLAYANRRWGRLWFLGMGIVAALIHIVQADSVLGLTLSLRVAPLMLAALVLLELLIEAIFPQRLDAAENATERTEQTSMQRYRNYVNRIEALAVDRERARIAREFHDTLGHTLTTLDVQMELMARLPANRTDEIQEAAHHARGLVKDGLADVRRSIRALHPNALEGFSIVEAIESLIDEFKRASTIEIHWRVEGKVSPLAPDLALPLYRAAQEALTNVRRHSGASRAKITLAYTTEMIWLVVEDNGRACTPQKFGFGLSGIRDRVRELHGHFAAGPRIEGGFRLVVKLPRHVARIGA